MALKDPDIYPQWSVHVWEEMQGADGEWFADCTCAGCFDNEFEAFALYKSIRLGNGIVEVDLQKDTEDNYFPVRHKDTAGEYIY